MQLRQDYPEVLDSYNPYIQTLRVSPKQLVSRMTRAYGFP